MISEYHIMVVEERLLDYEKAIAASRFKPLQNCLVCFSTDGFRQCGHCLFGQDDLGHSFPCSGPSGTGDCLEDKQKQRTQYGHLLKSLDNAGYEFTDKEKIQCETIEAWNCTTTKSKVKTTKTGVER